MRGKRQKSKRSCSLDVYLAGKRDEVIYVKEHGVELASDHTALSQHRNLYFVAFGDEIYVYKPSGRGRALAPQPEIIITPVMKNPRARAYITPQNPQTINVIRVDDLGHEEILLLATDNGNVAAYRTERIFAVIEEARATGINKPRELGELVECFFSDWVGQSAWGLAVHTNARLVAVSSNSWCITVYAFALVDPEAPETPAGNVVNARSSGDALEWTNVSLESQYSTLRRMSQDQRRARNIRFTLVGHRYNIPNIGFLNSNLDPYGDWLVSTDISNKLMFFNIWHHPAPVKIIDLQRGLRKHPGNQYDNRRVGWNVLAIDPRNFRPKATLQIACGGTPHKLADYDNVHDLSKIARRMRYTRQDTQHPDNSRVEDQELDGNFSMGSDIDISSRPASPAVESLMETPSESIANTLPSLQGDAPDLLTDAELIDALLVSVIDTAQDLPQNELDDIDDFDAQEADSEDEGEPEEEEEVEGESEHGGDVDSVVESYAGFHNYVYAAFQNGGSGSDLTLIESLQQHSQGGDTPEKIFPDISSWLSGSEEADTHRPLIFADFPILHFSERVVHMFAHPFAKKASFILHDPLFQDGSSNTSNLGVADRFNMVHQIPELGVVLAASQKGRVVILSLTECPDGKAFRLDHIIPFESQEKRGDRPEIPLVGIAVGPVENHLLPLDEVRSSRSSQIMDDTTNVNAASSSTVTQPHHHRRHGEKLIIESKEHAAQISAEPEVKRQPSTFQETRGTGCR
ncbi:hypothetical protein PAAG_04601 [Paracoccidioides lutzii Pb01]|uniref:Uncharacterized protein n=1 Tax=Paracoccidioides lutzii (strain ATCC MYA-826 / Pb01) TaxID=502779 RepID=C1H1F7_PARBA|nr:hypothetical protein PAAG_04601 [Paracoccidioides lutzii Pb01]EEH33551.2 hypothetical protein PAAG_04601 [Paracoccidioides lutzii Pb01]